MKLTRFLFAAGVAASVALPLAASAQQAPPPPYNQQQPYGAQQQPYGAPQQGPGQGRNQVTQSADSLQRHYGQLFQSLNVTGQQQAQIGALINAYSQSHPAGSPLDRGASRDLRQQILAVLSPDQQAQFRQYRQQLQAQRRAHRQQLQQQQPQQQQQIQQQQQPPEPQEQPGQPPAI